MSDILVTLFIVLAVVCVLSMKVGIYSEIVEIHILGLIKIRIKNKEKRLKESFHKPSRRISKRNE